jgi:carboxypeptidase Taq
MEPALTELQDRLGTLTDLRRIASVLLWDMTVWMPPGGGPSRAAQLATIESIIHGREVDERLGEAARGLEPYAESLPADSTKPAHSGREARLTKARRVPVELATDLVRTAAQSYEVWVKAREESDFASFRPWLEQIVELRRRYVECFSPYDDRTTRCSTTSSPG